MRSSLRVLVKPLPISSIPPQSLRLPPRSIPSPNLETSSPTISKLLSKLSSSSPVASASSASETNEESSELPSDGRGLGGFKVKRAGPAGGNGMPSNLRIEEWVPKRREFEGVGKKHRDLLRRLRREA
ncbi:uncharacterized protein JCM6883_004424 [Sporobolomyces salmoneus]|uniref:uncharacterized protein n=1 Tax=Sporobolomyces salmoneus TaxID=183962 RepID=UPI00316BF844